MTHWILVDYENVQPSRFSRERLPDARILIFLGPGQNRLPAELVAALQPFGTAAEYIQVSARGNNALDFHVAFHLGRLATEHPGDHFHVISADRGFDPLLNHMRQKLGLSASRHKTLPGRLPGGGAAADEGGDVAERIATEVRSSLAAVAKRERPRTVRTLRNWIRSTLAADLDDRALDRVVDRLRGKRLLTTNGDRIAYRF